MSKVEAAVAQFRSGCACSQAILATYGPEAGLDRELALRIASGFAGGMRMAETCGAVTGALMVLGLRHAGLSSASGPGRAEVYSSVKDYVARFSKRRGTVICRELLGCDISTPEGAAEAKERDLFRTLCAELVRDAAELLESARAPGG